MASAAKQIQFNLIFPREGIYRVWVQFQRQGVVNYGRLQYSGYSIKRDALSRSRMSRRC